MHAVDTSPRPRRIRDYFRRYGGSFALGIAALVATQGFSLAVPRLLREATDALSAGDGAAVQGHAWTLLLVAVLGASVRIASRLLIFNAGRNVEYDLRTELFAILAKQPASYYDTMPTGQVMSRLVNDLTQVRLLLGPGLLNLTNTAIVYVVVVPLLFGTDATLAIATLFPLPLLLWGGRLIGKRMFEDVKESQERLAKLSSRIQESLGGVQTVRVYAREEAERRAFDALNAAYVDVNMRLARMRGLMFPLMGLAGAIGTVVLLAMGGDRIMRGEMTVGQFVEFNAYLVALTWPTIALGWMWSLYQRGVASMGRVNQIFTAVPTLADGPAPAPAREGSAPRVELRDLRFAYPRAQDRPALDGLTVSIAPGETVVVVGKTGSGKSTLVKLLARLLEVAPGQLFVDGRDVTELPLDAVRRLIAYAPQEAFLFSRTIFENVAFGRGEATDAEVEAAVAAAGLSPDLAAFKDGLDTIVGERGITLSGGQRQRATLARALLLDAPVLLLDDTLSAVDTETETRILGELARRRGRHTTVLVTHRLAAANLADRILVLDAGRVVEQGTEAELLALGGIYAEMHRHQRLREALEGRAA